MPNFVNNYANTMQAPVNTFNVGKNLQFPSGRIPEESIRRKYNLGNSVSELNVDLTPFYTFVSKVRNDSTNDRQFKTRQHRGNSILKKEFNVNSEIRVNDDGNGAATSTRSFTIKSSEIEGGKPKFILPKQTISWKTTYYDSSDTAKKPIKIGVHTARIDSIDGSGNLTCTLTSPNSEIAVIPKGANVTIIGTAWEEGSRSPNSWYDSIQADYGQTQIWKTACEMTGSSMATEYSGYEDEWARLWGMKMPEHNLDIENSIMFQNKYQDNDGLLYTDGIASFATRHPSCFGWSVQKYGSSAFHYDDFLGMAEAMFDRGTGNSKDKLVLCGTSVLTYLNKIKNGFMSASVQDSWLHADIDWNSFRSPFNHEITQLKSIHGRLNFTEHPKLRGAFSDLAIIIDLNNVKFRPLSGNGRNRDTHILTNVQENDRDMRKDMILTEGGLEIDFAETHGYLYFNGGDGNAPAEGDEPALGDYLTNEEKAEAYLQNYGDIQGDSKYEDALTE